MKRFFTLLLMIGIIAFSGTTYELMAQDGSDSTATEAATPVADTSASDDEAEESDEPIDEVLKRRFIEGGWDFMSLPLICLILGLAFAIERILTLNLSTVNTGKLLKKVEGALSEGDVDRAKEICRSTRGPVASVFYQGLDRSHEGLDVVERSIVSYGSVQMGRLQKGLVWIALFIALAPMLGFMGTVIGMIEAFDSIEKAGDISPGVVARGIKIALLTTVFGLVVAIILQIFYNYISSKVDSLVNTMEDASISLVDLMSKYKVSK
ncbi:MAG: MotA/TolQ/ExbB proton channel family protein [Chitinophagales bacterium]